MIKYVMVIIMINLELTEKEKQGLTEDEIEIAMARKLEILVLPHLRRNIKFFYAGGDLIGKSKAYNEVQKKEDLEQIMNSNKNMATVCKPICIMVSEILRDNGINAETVSCDTDIFGHTDVLITTKSGKKYIINYLEDMEMIQTGMNTSDFAAEKYYKRRYEKFEGSFTVDGKSLEGIAFISEDRLDKIDSNLGYKKYNMYMNEVIEQIKKEFASFKEFLTEDEILSKQFKLEKEGRTLTKEEIEQIKQKYIDMSDSEVLEKKLDYIFSYLNIRGSITGHTDFVMYYSRLLLKEVLTQDEYNKLTRLDCIAKTNTMPNNSKLQDVLDIENQEEINKKRFCVVKLENTYYVFSTKPNSYIKLDSDEFKVIEKNAIIKQSEKPSDLMLELCDIGHALPLVFHPLGSKIINERANLIDANLDDEQRKIQIKDLISKMKLTDLPITSISIPYPDGTRKLIYIDENYEFVLKDGNKKVVYHYNEENDDFEKEIIAENDSKEER